MKKIFLSAFLMLSLISAQTIAQKNAATKSNEIQYHFFTNNIPSDFNYPLIGFVNNVDGNHASLQIGIVNSTTGNFGGIQTGFINSIGGNVTGLQSGFINSIGGNLMGAAYGFINSVNGEVSGLQYGFINSANASVAGLQCGFINSTGQSVYGVQCGFINSAGDVRGLQHGFINSAKSLRGLQLGFINSVDDVEKGLPIGFLSFVKHNGYKAIEYSYTDLLPYNLAFKTGIREFYTFPMVSWNPELEDELFVGYGIGSNVDFGKSIFFNPELLSQHNISLDFNHFLSLKANIGVKLSDHFELVAGPALSWNVKIDADDFHQNYTEWNPDILSVNKLSIGYNAALRICF